MRTHPQLSLRTFARVGSNSRDTSDYVVGAITAFNALMNADGASAADFASFVSVYSGGAAIPPSLANEIKAVLNVEIKPCCGVTETSSPSHDTPPGREPPVDQGSGALAIGVPIFSTDAIVVDDQGEAVAPGQRSQVWIRGPQIMAGYWNKLVETSEALSGSWLRIGDIAVMDAAGWFYLVDRKKDMITHRGSRYGRAKLKTVCTNTLLCARPPSLAS